MPVRMENLVPGAKNLGMTHTTSGCHRLHPVELSAARARWPPSTPAAALIRVNRTCAFRRMRLPSSEMTRTIDIQTPMGVLTARSGSAI
jgi:hypothetical protein